MTEDFPDLKISRTGNNLLIAPSGSWSLNNFELITQLCQKRYVTNQALDSIQIEIEALKLSHLDTAGAKALINFLYRLFSGELKQVTLKNFKPESKKLFELVSERVENYNLSLQSGNKSQFSLLAQIGILVFQAFKYLQQIFSFLGLVVEGLFHILFKPSLFRVKELITQLEEACIKSILVVSLVTF